MGHKSRFREGDGLVLLSYYQAVTREHRFIPFCWTYLVLILLFLIAICGFLSGASSIMIVRGFGEQAIFQSRFIYTLRDQPLRGVGIFDVETTDNATREAIIRANTSGFYRRRTEGKEVSVEDEVDYIFLTTMTVDIMRSVWGPITLRDYIIFYPFIMEIAAIIWGIILIVFRTGKEKHWGLSQPWMIVVPSIFFFGVMFLLTIIYAIIVAVSWEDLCANAMSQLISKDLSCAMVLHAIQPTPKRAMLGFYFHVFIYSYLSKIATSLWLGCFLIMILRCVFAIDFQLMYVTVSAPRDYSRTVHNLEDGTKQSKKLARDRESEDDFHSAHSTLTTFLSNEDDHPSKKALLADKKVKEQVDV